MLNSKGISLLLVLLCISGCNDDGHFFDTALINTQSQQIEFKPVHQLNLTIEDMNKNVDESGFSPKFKSHFRLSDTTKGPWPQAWVAFVIELSIKNKRLAQITRAGAMNEHTLQVDIEQTLPSFGINEKDISISVKPIAWMPTFPLNIQDTAHNSDVDLDEKVTSVN